MRLAVMLVAAVCAALLGGSADSARTQGGADWTLRPVADGQKWLRVNVQGDTLYGFRVRGTDFAVTGIKSVRASGGTTPQCAVSGTPATVACDGDLPGGISVFVQLMTSGSGGAYDFALLFQPADPNLFYVPSNQKAPPVPLGGSLGFTPAGTARVTISNPSATRSFQQLEIAPIGFQARNVLTPDCGITEGAGIVCEESLGPRRTAVIRFTPDGPTSAASAVLSAAGADTGFAFVQAGDACPDVGAAVARLQAELAVLRSHLGVMARMRAAGPLLRTLRAKVNAVTTQLARQKRQLTRCAAGQAPKTEVAAACDADGKAVAQAQGKVAGLSAVLPIERRVAVRVKPLRNLPRRTQKALRSAKAASARAGAALTACQASLAQD